MCSSDLPMISLKAGGRLYRQKLPVNKIRHFVPFIFWGTTSRAQSVFERCGSGWFRGLGWCRSECDRPGDVWLRLCFFSVSWGGPRGAEQSENHWFPCDWPCLWALRPVPPELTEFRNFLATARMHLSCFCCRVWILDCRRTHG